MFEEQWWCVRSVATDGSGHSITETDVMPDSALWSTVGGLTSMVGVPVQGGVGDSHRWTWSQAGRSDMIIASRIH